VPSPQQELPQQRTVSPGQQNPSQHVLPASQQLLPPQQTPSAVQQVSPQHLG
jgi:hypothetical protein